MTGHTSLDDLRDRAGQAGFHVFLSPDRPSGWVVTIRNGDAGFQAPTEARAATRDDAVALADRLFVSQRLVDLDRAIRAAGLQPPFWGSGGQNGHLAALEQFARERGIAG